VDSLDGIEDLEAYLDAQPALSQFPTPPTRLSKTSKGLGRVPLTTAGVETPQVRHEFDESHRRDVQPESLDCKSISLFSVVFCLAYITDAAIYRLTELEP
jgi:hypothetical protein